MRVYGREVMYEDGCVRLMHCMLCDIMSGDFMSYDFGDGHWVVDLFLEVSLLLYRS